MLYIRDLIRKKRNKEELTEEEAKFFIYSYNRDEILKEQAAALLTLMYTNGLTEKEMAYLSQAMAETGEQCEIYKLSNIIVDINPIGGVDDKIVIMLIAIISALNLPSAKIIGREIGVADKLIGVNTYKINEKNTHELKKKLDSNQIILIEEPENTAPVEKKLYKLRNDIACNDDISLIALSLMSQKIAIGVRNMVFDISYGEKAYVKTLRESKILSKYLVQMGEKLNRGVECIITKLNEPIGKFFGNTLELNEVLEALKGNMEDDVKELILELGSKVIYLTQMNANIKQNKHLILNVIESGKAYKKLIELLQSNGNNIEFTKTKNIVPVLSQTKGYVENIDVSLIRTTAKYLNAIRHRREDKLDIGAGIEFNKKIGDKVEVGEILGYIYTNDETKIEQAVVNFKESYHISNSKIKRKSRIIEN